MTSLKKEKNIISNSEHMKMPKTKENGQTEGQKDKKKALLEKRIENLPARLYVFVKDLENYTSQDIQTVHDAICEKCPETQK